MGTINDEHLIHRHPAKNTDNKTTTDESTSSSSTCPANSNANGSINGFNLSTEIIKNSMNGHLSHEEELQKLKEIGSKTPILPSEIGTDFSFKRDIVWPNAIGFALLHICAAIGCLLCIFNISDPRTTAYCEYFYF